MQKLAGAVTSVDDLTRQDPTGGSGVMSYEAFQSALQRLAAGQLSDHEMISVARFYQDRKDDRLGMETLVAVSQEQLRKVNYEGFSKILAQCEHYDQNRYWHGKHESMVYPCGKVVSRMGGIGSTDVRSGHNGQDGNQQKYKVLKHDFQCYGNGCIMHSGNKEWHWWEVFWESV